jgi:perosamine synthetase
MSTLVPPIRYTQPSIGALEIEYATDAVRHGWGAHCYDYITRFERGLERAFRVPHAVATSSGTGALHLGLAALGVTRGDEVILGELNWIASAAPIVHLGASPVLVDVDPVSWCLDPARVEAAITPRTRAIIAVHLYGNLCDMEALLAIGARYGIPVIEDAAEAIGSSWGSVPAGSRGQFGVFSFHGTKTLTTGEGGALVTADRALHKRIGTLNNHGRAANEPRQFWPEMVGYKFKMSNVQAAIGCAQLERVDELVAQKRRVFWGYRERLDGLPLTMNPEAAGTTNGFWMPTIVVDAAQPFDRDALLQAMAIEGIDGRVCFWPLSSLDMFTAQPENSVAYGLHHRALNLPSHPELTDDELDRVAAVVRQHVGGPSW